MLIKVYTNKVVLVDDDGNVAAGLDYPKTQNGICEIGSVYRNNLDVNPNMEAKLMELALQQVRKKNLKVIPTDVFSKEWFNKHPEDRDLVAVEEVAQPEVQDVTKTQVVDIEKIEEQLDERPSSEPEEHTEAVITGGPGAFSRFLQLLSAILMGAITGIYGYKAYQYVIDFMGSNDMSIIMQNLDNDLVVSNLAFIIVSAILIILGIVQFFWILTNKKVSENGSTYTQDKGRGFIGFIIVLIIYLCAFAATNNYLPIDTTDLVPYFFQEAIIRQLIPILAIVGWIFCAIRKIVGKPKAK